MRINVPIINHIEKYGKPLSSNPFLGDYMSSLHVSRLKDAPSGSVQLIITTYQTGS